MQFDGEKEPLAQHGARDAGMIALNYQLRRHGMPADVMSADDDWQRDWKWALFLVVLVGVTWLVY